MVSCGVPRGHPCLLVGWMQDAAGCEGVGGAGVGHAFARVVHSLWGQEHRAMVKRSIHRWWSDSGIIQRVLLTHGVSVAEVRRGRRGGRGGWSEGPRRLRGIGGGGCSGGRRGGRCGRGRRGWKVLEVLLPRFILLQASPWIRLETHRAWRHVSYQGVHRKVLGEVY